MSRSNEVHRLADRYCGIPLAVVAGLFTRRSESPPTARRIGVIAASAIGDTILATGLLDHLARTFPEAEIHLLIGGANAPALQLVPTGVIGIRCDFTRPLLAIDLLRSLRLDVLVDPTPWPRTTALIARCAGARWTVGFRSQSQFRHFPFSWTVDHSVAVHETENLRRLANVFAPLHAYKPALLDPLPDPQLPLPYERLVLLHVRPGGSAAVAKSWPAPYWAELASRLCSDGMAVAFTGAAVDQPVIDSIVSRVHGRCMSLAGSLSLSELAFVMKRARLVITVDTAILHLASVLDRPVIGLHGPTRSRRWGATNRAARSIDSPHPAAGYVNFGFERHRAALEIMRMITVDAVYAEAERILSSDDAAVRRRGETSVAGYG